MVKLLKDFNELDKSTGERFYRMSFTLACTSHVSSLAVKNRNVQVANGACVGGADVNDNRIVLCKPVCFENKSVINSY